MGGRDLRDTDGWAAFRIVRPPRRCDPERSVAVKLRDKDPSTRSPPPLCILGPFSTARAGCSLPTARNLSAYIKHGPSSDMCEHGPVCKRATWAQPSEGRKFAKLGGVRGGCARVGVLRALIGDSWSMARIGHCHWCRAIGSAVQRVL